MQLKLNRHAASALGSGLAARFRAIWGWVGTNHDQVTIAFALIAGLYVLVEYRLKEKATTINRAMEFQARYSNAQMLPLRLKLQNYWLSPKSQQDIAAAAEVAKAKGLPETRLKSKLTTEVVLANHLEDSVFAVADFFQQVVTCAESGLCDEQTTCATFKDEAVALRNTYFDLFRRWESTWGENFGNRPYAYFSTHCAKT